MERLKRRKKRLSSFQIIIMGFAGVILLGAFLLMLPISSRSSSVTPFSEALFTSTSAVCVTGLVVHDTASYWSVFGQAVIFILIQIGGLGVVTVAASLALLSHRRISLTQRSTMQEAISAPGVGGIVNLTVFILKITFLAELVGAVAMSPVFIKDYGPKGIWMSFFHSVSAFCNAGFDILGSDASPYSSLTRYSSSALINIVAMLLIVLGGIGFLTWEDIFTKKHHIKRYRMQSKIILVTAAILILFPAIFFFFADFSSLPLKERLFCSLFQAITPRTAGFNTADLNSMTGPSRALIIVLMLIGGAPGSTAGGMKTTTVAVLVLNAIAVFRRKDDAEAFDRRIHNNAVRNASAILLMYAALFFSGALVISAVEKLPVSTCIFETASAIGTVGLTLGITPELGVISRSILIILMFFGRVGGLTLIYAALSNTGKKLSKLPQEKIIVG